MLRGTTLTILAMLVSATAAYADPIQGNWRTPHGDTAAIASCGSGFCISLKTGRFKGKSIGSMNANGGNQYSGSITDPETDKTYSGNATLLGSSLRLQGCVLGGLICKGQTWSKI